MAEGFFLHFSHIFGGFQYYANLNIETKGRKTGQISIVLKSENASKWFLFSKIYYNSCKLIRVRDVGRKSYEMW